MSRSWLDVDLGAIEANVKTLRALAPESELCAVVKADGYGHGAVPVACAAVDAGATRLAVAQVAEGRALRDAGLDVPIWVLSEPGPDEFRDAALARLEPAVYSPDAIDRAGEAGPLTVHLKIDTGMGRVGAAPDDAVSLAQRIERNRALTLGSVWTHLACADADEPEDGDGGAVEVTATPTTRQLDRYEQVLQRLESAGIEVPLRHAANSAGTIGHPRSHHDVVRCGIALYGLPPSPEWRDRAPLRPAMTWRTTVSFVKRVPAGTALSYGHRQSLPAESTVATIPVGYADGLRRALWNRDGAVLIGGRRRPIVGVVTMDQTLVGCSDDPVAAGDEVVIIGAQGEEAITADDQAAALDTINYEIAVAIGARVERRYHRG